MSKLKAVYAGSFDPITRGHMNIIARAAVMFDLTIAVGTNAKKKHWISSDYRTELVQESLGDELCYGGSHLDSVKVVELSCLLADFCTENSINIIIRGLRNTIDFEYEFGMAKANTRIFMGEGKLETVFLVTDQYDHISSSLVRELHSYNHDVRMMVPNPVWEYLNDQG